MIAGVADTDPEHVFTVRIDLNYHLGAKLIPPHAV
jgi:hypothetical protein